MDQQTVREILSGRRRGLAAVAARAGLAVAACPYAAAMKLRRWAYGKSLLKSRSVDVPVICVGNITTGGTGKTPLVARLVEHLKSIGCSPAILTRGYKGSGGASDEADLLAKLTGVNVIVKADRVAGARDAIEAGANVLVMDDGFQHRRLRRDLDIVLIDASEPFGYGHCLPRGLLREPLSALADAGAIVITRSDRVNAGLLASLEGKLRRLAPQAVITRAVHEPAALLDGQGSERDLGELSGMDAFAFCGLANPGPFFAGLADLGANLAGTAELDDHVQYTAAIIDRINRQAADSGAAALVTTEKDATKLAAAKFDLPLYMLSVRVKLTAGREELLGLVDRLVSSIASEAQG